MEPGTDAKSAVRGVFITFEGIEGSGKTTLMGLVAEALSRDGHDTVVTREPGGTDLGLALRRVLLDPTMERINPVAELMLFAADRSQHIAETIGPALEKGQTILCDRFSDATVAYQGYGRGLPLETVIAVDVQARGSLRPDLTVLIDLPVERGLARARARNQATPQNPESRIDEEELDFHSRVREGYLVISRREPDRFMVLDGLQSPEKLCRLVTQRIASRFRHGL